MGTAPFFFLKRMTKDGKQPPQMTASHADRRLRRQLDAGELKLLYDMESEQWDLLPAADAERLLDN